MVHTDPVTSAHAEHPARTNERRRTVLTTPVVVAGAALSALGGLVFVNPNTTHVPLCPLHALTGLNCPLCGATRASWELLHGHLGAALHDNALYVLGLPVLLMLWWRWFEVSRSGAPAARMLPRWLSRSLIVLALVFGVARNLPFGQFLAPVS